MSEQPLVLRETDAPLARVIINRPDKLNALNAEVIRRLGDAFSALGREEEVKVIILTGAGDKAFVAGADIAEMAAMTPEQAREFARQGQRIGAILDGLGKPVIAAVGGFALGGGCELAMMCHLRVAAPGAKFSQPEVGLGLIPGFGGTQRLARLVGEGRALEMILGGQMIDAATAHRWGLVNVVAEEGTALEAAEALARRLARQGPVALAACLRAVRSGLQMPLEQALEYEAALFGGIFATEDMREGTAAFLDKRRPNFQGR
ncbi:MAG: enoyl-CoA hydratase-related protein [Acidobacteriota bacterium]|nr:enoyl-CoA hydratase-related protein [Acidobacteriota bacterium]